MRGWLHQPECQLVREIVATHLATLQAECGSLLIEGVEKENQTVETAKAKAKEAVAFSHTLSVLDRFASEDGVFVRAKADVL